MNAQTFQQPRIPRIEGYVLFYKNSLKVASVSFTRLLYALTIVNYQRKMSYSFIKHSPSDITDIQNTDI